MLTNEPAVTVTEVSMQEWAMLAFHAARAPQRVRVTVKTAPADAAVERPIGGARAGFWVPLAVAMAGLAWLLI
jgi:hypothetical protein